MNEPELVATGLTWLGIRGVNSILTVMKRTINQSKKEILIAAYSITHGIDDFLLLIENALARGVNISIVINRLDNQTTKDILLDLKMKYTNFRIFDFAPKKIEEDLHAKVIVSDRKLALIGSANFTKSGFVTNHEIGVVVEGFAAKEAARLVRKLIQDKKVKEVL